MIDKEILIQEYIINKKSAKEVGSLINKSGTQVLYWMKEYNLPIRKPGGGSQIIDLSGQKFGDYIVIGKSPNSKLLRWDCKCSCGRIKSLKSQTLTSNEARSCGLCKPKHNNKSYKDIPGCYWSKIKYGAKKRNLEINVTIEEAWDIFIKQNKKCIYTGIELNFYRRRKEEKNKQTASLDRIDSKKGYIINNIQWVHKEVNILKNNLSEDEFLYWIRKIYENTKK